MNQKEKDLALKYVDQNNFSELPSRYPLWFFSTYHAFHLANIDIKIDQILNLYENIT